MSDKKITDLVVSPGAAATDLHEVANVTGVPVSQKQSNAQIATFMQTAMALVQLSGGNIKLNADGSASFAGVKILFNADGSCTFASANAGFAADGALNLPLSHLLADGSAQFANGVTTIAADGALNVASGANTLNANGSSSLSNGAIAIDTGGVITTSGEFEGTSVGQSLVIKSPDGTRWRLTVSDVGVPGFTAV